jgi:hypothetical protein
MSQKHRPKHPIADDAMDLAKEIDGMSTRHAASLIEEYGNRCAARFRDQALEDAIEEREAEDEFIASELFNFEKKLADRLERFAPPLHPVIGALSRRLCEGYGDDDDCEDFIDLCIGLAMKIIQTIESSGARIVPEEPSREMKEAGADRGQEPGDEPFAMYRDIYKAMIAAVPRIGGEVVDESLEAVVS